MNKKVLVGLLSVLLIGLVVYGCGEVVKEDKVTGSGTLIGKVYKIDGTNALDGVTVTVTGVTTPAVTNTNGYFSFLIVPAVNRATVNFSKTGYVSTCRITTIKSGIVNYIDTNMAAQSTPTTFLAEDGGDATESGTDAKVTITGGTLRDASGNAVTGNVDVYVTSFDPSDQDQARAFPGNFAGLVGGREQPFISQGFMDIAVEQGGQPVYLNSTARIEIPISQVADASDTIPLWYFENGYWKQQGIATKVGNVWQADVPHFSTWNADYLYEEAYKSGRVVDSDGNPVADATVVVEGDGWRNETTTDSNGYYTLPVEPNSWISEWARKGTKNSFPVTELMPPTGETETVANIVLPDPLATITLIWGAEPRDLDSHLTGPGETARFHIDYSVKQSPDGYASLDIDYRQGYGPEHIVVSKFRQGIYRYCVHHFAGDSTIRASEAQVRLDVPKKGIIGRFFFPPSTGGSGDEDVWQVFDMTVDSAGNVTVSSLDAIVESPYPVDPYDP